MLNSVSIAAAHVAMQRGRWTSNRLPFDSVTVYDRAECVRALELCSRRSFDDSSAHSGPFAATTTEARIFRRTPEGGSGMLPSRHTRGSEIPRKTGSQRARQGESQITSRKVPF